jgi:DNA-binding ferritin-like protein
MKDKDRIATTARDLAFETANTAVALATTAAKTAADLAAKTAESTTEIRTNMVWMMKSLSSIEQTLGEMQKSFVTAVQHTEVLKVQRDHEQRMRTIEKNMWLLAGGLLIISFATPFLMKIIFKI